MLILERVEQKKECRGPKWGGLLPISSLRSRHCSGVATGGIVVCTAGAFYAHDQGSARARGGVPEKACRDKPLWVLYRDRGFPVTTKMARLVLR